MKRHLITLSIGLIAGTLLTLIIVGVVNENTGVDLKSLALLDSLIIEWTSPVDSSQTSYAVIGSDHKKYTIGTLPDSALYYEAQVDSLYHIQKGVVCAQFILESKWGMSNLGANNYFGLTYEAVKKYMQRPSFVWRTDLRVDENGLLTRRVPVRFAKFASMAQCFDVYGRYLTGSRLYRKAFKQKSAEKFVRALARYYAQDPDYAIKLILIMRRYNLE